MNTKTALAGKGIGHEKGVLIRCMIGYLDLYDNPFCEIPMTICLKLYKPIHFFSLHPTLPKPSNPYFFTNFGSFRFERGDLFSFRIRSYDILIDPSIRFPLGTCKSIYRDFLGRCLDEKDGSLPGNFCSRFLDFLARTFLRGVGFSDRDLRNGS